MNYPAREKKPISQDWRSLPKVAIFLRNNLLQKLGVDDVRVDDEKGLVLCHHLDNQADIARAIARLVPKEATVQVEYIYSPCVAIQDG